MVKYRCRLQKVEEHKVIQRDNKTSVQTNWFYKHSKGTIVLRTKGDVPDFPRHIGTDFDIDITHMQTSMNKEVKGNDEE